MAKKLRKSAEPLKDIMALYSEDLGKFQLLKAEEEIELGKRIAAGDQKARDELVQANLRFVVDVAQRYAARYSEKLLQDLIGAGNIGLMRAAEGFDWTKGHRFLTYAAWWIKQKIRLALKQHGKKIAHENTSLESLGAEGLVPPENHANLLPDMRLLNAFKVLKPKEREIIIKSFGLEDGMRCSLAVIGLSLIPPITGERVRQIKNRALKKMRLKMEKK